MEEHDIPYFRNLWESNMKKLHNQCEVWEKICLTNSIPDEVLGDIRTNIGLAKLLMNQKLKQFKGLIDDSEFNTGEKEITCLDLQGFWDMVYNEVEKIMNCFNRLQKCKENEWNFEVEESVKPAEKKIPVKREVAAMNKKDDASKSRALAARQRLAEAKKKMLALRKQQNIINNNSEVIGGLLSTESSIVPKKKESIDNLKRNVYVDEKQITPFKTSNQDEDADVNKRKHEADLQKSFLSVRDKENLEPRDKGSNTKHNSSTITSSNEKNGDLSSKKRGKSKDYGKLQCLTRSAKKALLQENSRQE